MVIRVIIDLKVFMFFYFILVLIFSMIFAIIGVGNDKIEGDFQQYTKDINDANEFIKIDGHANNFWNVPNEEYYHIGLFLGYII